MTTSTQPLLNTTLAVYTPAVKLTQLTFSRFVAAMAIVVFHFKGGVLPVKVESLTNFIGYFDVLVSYFFVLSGFILTVNYKQLVHVKQFYLNRFARIYPLYLFALVFTLLLVYNARTPNETIGFTKVFLNASLLQAWFKQYVLTYNYPAWSLSVEAFFYLLFPYVMYLLQNKKITSQLFYIVLCWLAMQVASMLMIVKGNYFILYHPLFHLSTFLIGIAGGKLFMVRYALLVSNISKLELLSAAAVLVICYLIISKNIFFNTFYHNGFLAPVFVLFIYTMALSNKRFFTSFNIRGLQYLGEISYGIYILQIPVSILVYGLIDRTIHTSSTLSFYIFLTVLICMSAITHECIEKPCRALIRKRFNKIPTS